MMTREQARKEINDVLSKINQEFLDAGGDKKWSPFILSVHDSLLRDVVEEVVEPSCPGGDGGDEVTEETKTRPEEAFYLQYRDDIE